MKEDIDLQVCAVSTLWYGSSSYANIGLVFSKLFHFAKQLRVVTLSAEEQRCDFRPPLTDSEFSITVYPSDSENTYLACLNTRNLVVCAQRIYILHFTI
jgi:hypothetical protein